METFYHTFKEDDPIATPKKTYPYAIYYNDGSYMIYDLTLEDFGIIEKALTPIQAPYTSGGITYGPTLVSSAVKLSIGILSIRDIRSVIKQNPPPKPKKNEGSTPDLTAEEIEWMAITKAQWRETEGGYDL